MLALEGIKVLELFHMPIVSICAMTLGDLGAEVVKIEMPPQEEGTAASPMGYLSRAGEKAGRGNDYYPLDRNKKSLCLNLKDKRSRDIFFQLATKADVVLEGFRPGVTTRLGIDYHKVSKVNPRIVYCSITGYGQDGPYQNLPGHDVNYIALGGVLGLMGERETPPPIPLNIVADISAGALHATIGILAALTARRRTRRGQQVDISMFDGVVSFIALPASAYFAEGTAPRRGEHLLGGAFPYYNVYETRDGKFISLGCLEPHFWEKFCHAVGREDLLPFHFSPEHWLNAQGAKWEQVFCQLRELFLTKTRDEWFELLSPRDVPVGKVYEMAEVFSDPQVLHRQMVVEVDTGQGDKVKQVGLPIKLSHTPGKIRWPSPPPGAHTEEILQQLGYSKAEVAALRQSGAIG